MLTANNAIPFTWWTNAENPHNEFITLNSFYAIQIRIKTMMKGLRVTIDAAEAAQKKREEPAASGPPQQHRHRSRGASALICTAPIRTSHKGPFPPLCAFQQLGHPHVGREFVFSWGVPRHHLHSHPSTVDWGKTRRSRTRSQSRLPAEPSAVYTHKHQEPTL